MKSARFILVVCIVLLAGQLSAELSTQSNAESNAESNVRSNIRSNVRAMVPCRVCDHEDGSLNITFGNHGRVVSNKAQVANGLVILPCGTIVAAGPQLGTIIIGNRDFVVVGFTLYGQLDSSFGNGGATYTDFATVLGMPGTSDDIPSAIAIQRGCSKCDSVRTSKCGHECSTNSKLVVVGSSSVFGTQHIALARYNSDGSLDTTFGTNGVVVTPIGLSSGARAVAIQDDGKIVIAGRAFINSMNQFVVARYNCDGTLDNTFGCDVNNPGVVVIRFHDTGDSIAEAIVIQKNGKIVVGGIASEGAGGDFALARLTPTGALDKSFGPDHTGKVLTAFSTGSIEIIHSLVLVDDCRSCCDIHADGLSIVAVGGTSTDTGAFALAGYKDNGSLDPSFGSEGNGRVVTFFPNGHATARAAVVHQDRCTKECTIIAAGFVVNEEVIPDFALARYKLNGRLDDSFGDDGRVVTHFPGHNSSEAFSLVVEPSGDVIAGGDVGVAGSTNLALARYNICESCCI